MPFAQVGLQVPAYPFKCSPCDPPTSYAFTGSADPRTHRLTHRSTSSFPRSGLLRRRNPTWYIRQRYLSFLFPSLDIRGLIFDFQCSDSMWLFGDWMLFFFSFLFFNFLFFGCRVVGWFNLFNFGLFPVFVVVRWDPVVFCFCFLLRGLFPFLMILSSTFYNPLSSLFNYSFSNGGFYYRTTYDETP